MSEKMPRGEFNIDVQQVKRVAGLAFGSGKVGLRERLVGDEAEAAYAKELAAHTSKITNRSTADCGDERRTVRLADGTSDSRLLSGRVVAQMFGGLALPATKAAVAANAAIVRDAKNFQMAYETISAFLADNNYEDGGHKGCGASGSVEASAAFDVAPEDQLRAIGLFAPIDAQATRRVSEINAHKQELLLSGFYGAWEPSWHEDFLSTRFPQNFSILADDPTDHDTHGHHGSGLYVISGDELGFEKNRFITDTAQEAFCVTPSKMRELAYLMGGTQDETARIELAFYDDTLTVGAGIVAKDFPVFA